jgi:hypothetical protein
MESPIMSHPWHSVAVSALASPVIGVATMPSCSVHLREVAVRTLLTRERKP